MDAAPMSSEERAPSVERPDPSGNPIVEILVEKRCGRRVDGGNGRRPCGYEGLVDDDVSWDRLAQPRPSEPWRLATLQA
jgi:hypothetical protein